MTAVNKISKMDATDLARELLPRLADEGQAGSHIEEFCSTYSGAARTDVLLRLAELAKQRRIEIADDVLAGLVRKNIDGQRAPGAERLLKALMEVGANCGVQQGGAAALATALRALSETTNSESFRAPLSRLGEKSRVKTRRVAGCLAQLVSRKAPTGALELWAEIAIPCMGGLTKPMSFTQKECDLMLGSISRLAVKDIPRSLEARLPLLLSSSGATAAQEFLASPVGERFRKNVGNLYGPALGSDPVPGGEQPKSRFSGEQAGMLDEIENLLIRLDDANGQFEERHRSEIETLRRAHREDLAAADEMSRHLRNDLEEMRSRNDKLVEENESLRREADDLKRKLVDFRNEVEQLTLEVDSRQADDQDRLAEDLRATLLEPAGNLRDTIEGMASQIDGSGPVRPVAVAFEQLHRKLRRRLNAKDERRIDDSLLKG